MVNVNKFNETKSDPEKLDVVVKTTRHDLVPYLQLQRDLLKHSSLGGKVYVTVPERDYDLFQDNMNNSFELMTDQHILHLAHFDDPIEDSWFTQQLIKLLSFVIVNQDAYIIIDANTLINQDFDESDFRVNGQWIYGLEESNLINLEWEKNTRLFLGLSPTPIVGFRPVNQVFIKRNLQALMDYLENRAKTKYVATLLRLHRQPQDTESPQWTEFNLYGIFTMFLTQGAGHYFCQRSVWYFNPFKTPAIKDKILQGIQNQQPLMVKVYKRRPGGILSIKEYETAVEQVKACYRRQSTFI